MTSKRLGCIAVLLLVLLCGSMMLNFVLVVARGSRISQGGLLVEHAPQFVEQTVEGGSSSSKIALITLRGLISSSVNGTLGETMVDDLRIALNQAASERTVKAIVLYVDSPGGEVTASDMIYAAVRKARRVKPVVVYMGSVAASGGYYVSCAGNYLMANDTTITGSIGVIIETMNYQQLLGKVGVEAVIFKSGKFKDILNGARPMTEEEKTFIQDMVMQTYGKFVGIVARERGLPEQQLRNGIADGRIISGKDAVGLKLINAVGQIEDAYAKARELGNAPDAAVIRYEAGFKLGRLFRMFGSSESTKVEIDLTNRTLPKLEAGKIYLLPGMFAP